MALHQRTSLEREEWKTLLWMDDLTAKNSMHYLLGILASIPGLIKDSDRTQARQRTASPANQLKREEYHQRLIEVLGELLSRRWDLERFHPHAVFEVAPDWMKSICIDAKGIPMFKTILLLTSLSRESRANSPQHGSTDNHEPYKQFGSA
jgi:hypothetical protein